MAFLCSYCLLLHSPARDIPGCDLPFLKMQVLITQKQPVDPKKTKIPDLGSICGMRKGELKGRDEVICQCVCLPQLSHRFLRCMERARVETLLFLNEEELNVKFSPRALGFHFLPYLSLFTLFRQQGIFSWTVSFQNRLCN